MGPWLGAWLGTWHGPRLGVRFPLGMVLVAGVGSGPLDMAARRCLPEPIPEPQPITASRIPSPRPFPATPHALPRPSWMATSRPARAIAAPPPVRTYRIHVAGRRLFAFIPRQLARLHLYACFSLRPHYTKTDYTEFMLHLNFMPLHRNFRTHRVDCVATTLF